MSEPLSGAEIKTLRDAACLSCGHHELVHFDLCVALGSTCSCPLSREDVRFALVATLIAAREAAARRESADTAGGVKP